MMKKVFAVAMIATSLACLPASSLAQGDDAPPVNVAVPLSPELLEQGVHGTVVLRVVISLANKIESQSILKSSGSKVLDEYVTSHLAGAPVAPDLIKTPDRSLTLEADGYAYRKGNFGRDYFCDQAVRDFDWYAMAFPEAPFERGPLYFLLGGSSILGGSEALAFTRDGSKYEKAWRTAVEECRHKPKEPFVPMLTKYRNK